MGPAGAKFRHRPALRRPNDTVGFGGNQGLVVQGEQQEGFDKLGLDSGCPNSEQGLAGEYGGALRHGPDVAGKPEVPEEVEELLAEAALAPKIAQVLLVKAQLLDILDDLGQAGGQGKAALVGDRAIEHVKIADPVGQPGLEVAVGHRQLVEVAEHGQVGLCFHLRKPP